MLKSIVIFGSARKYGHTRKAVDMVLDDYKYQFVDLSTLTINPFDYETKHHNDDFIALMRQIIECDQIFLATPIYWYGPSTIMKIFLDRFSDILQYPYKQIGKSLAGKKLFVISSNGVSSSKCFEDVFEQTAEYLNMQYMGCYNYHSGNDEEQIMKSKQELINFQEKLLILS